ncbi:MULTISPECIES: nuclear transport factor 2 family protein [Streptomyces]|uniref:nuclear transport factor 2 family protein n=1 Tax=Streptomyces TaxID=1883 RepID=UPI0003033905|nr:MULTISPECIES: nuclear transport factor 2 family protein [Streptomyces]
MTGTHTRHTPATTAPRRSPVADAPKTGRAPTADPVTTAPAPEARAVVEEFLSRVGAGDPERIAALFAEQVDWMIADNPVVPWVRPRPTRADVAAHFRELAAGVEPMAPRGRPLEALVVEGDEAVVTGNLAGRVRATGKEFVSPFALRLTVERGLVVRYHLYEDGVAVAAACTPDEADRAPESGA